MTAAATLPSPPGTRLLIEPPGAPAEVVAVLSHLLRVLERLAAAGMAGLRADPVLRCQIAALRTAGVPIMREGGANRLGAVMQRLPGS